MALHEECTCKLRRFVVLLVCLIRVGLLIGAPCSTVTLAIPRVWLPLSLPSCSVFMPLGPESITGIELWMCRELVDLRITVQIAVLWICHYLERSLCFVVLCHLV